MNNDQMTLLKKDGLELPLRTHPIRFAVRGKGGFTSNLWGVQVKRKGDAYIYCRDEWKDQKISLHASGKQHISFNENAPGIKSYIGGRFMNQWWEPQHTQKAVATLRLLFPPWGLSLNTQKSEKFQTKWGRNDVLIPAHDEMVTVVSFVIVDDGTRLKKEDGSPPSMPFGILRLRPGKSLFVIAGYEPEGDLKDKVNEALKEIAYTTDPKLLESEGLKVCLTGYTLENSIFMLPLAA